MTSGARTVSVAVMSDLHAAVPDKDGVVASYLSTAPLTASPQRDALLALKDLIERESLSADYLVCCGDMTDKADPTAMNYVWSEFHILAASLRARKAIAAVGNHDVDSRYQHNDHDSKGALLGLKPAYPLKEQALNYEYWARNFVVITEPEFRLVVLNSCAYHGVNPDKNLPEHLHGRISDRTLNDLKNELQTVREKHGQRPLNILVCHHHPHKHLDIQATDYSSMEGGEGLIDQLSSDPAGSWIVMHGHKHQPRLCWGAGGASPPLVFGAGSFSAKLEAALGTVSSNQFYIVTFMMDEAERLELDIAGTISTWDYGILGGWTKARAGYGLPAAAGFGWRPSSTRALVHLIESKVNAKAIVQWQELVMAEPKLKFLMPMDVNLLREKLKEIGIETDTSENGTIMQLGRKL